MTGSSPGGTIAVLDYGIGNLRSAEKALLHLGASAKLVTDPDEAADAIGVVLPGVGSFGPCATALKSTGLGEVALDAVAQGKPFLGICVGFQLLYDSSEESPGVKGLGIFPGEVKALPAGTKHPQMQWNKLTVSPHARDGLFSGTEDGSWVYFLHSFAPEITEVKAATCDYGGEVLAASQRRNVWGTQFHPEKSGEIGLKILGNFVDLCNAEGKRQ